MRARFWLPLVLLVAAVLAGWCCLGADRWFGGNAVEPAVGHATAASEPVPVMPAAAADAAVPPTRTEALPTSQAPVAGPRLHGTVRLLGGAACIGASVTAHTSGKEQLALLDSGARATQRMASATSDVAGHYELAVPASTMCTVKATAPGHGPAVRHGCRLGEQVDFTLAAAATLFGTVRDQRGNPAPATRLVVLQPQSFGGAAVVGETTSDGSGNYRLDDLPGGAVLLDVQPQLLAAPRDLDLQLLAGAVTRHDVVLLEGLVIRGRVLDAETRLGIADAEVGEGLVGRVVRTDAAGAFVLPGFASESNLSLRVRADGYAAAEQLLRSAGAGPAGTTTTVEILLARGFTVRGRVLDPARRPLAGSYVAAAAADHGGPGSWFRSDWRSVLTAADGAFQIESLRCDLQHGHDVMVVAAGFATSVHALPMPVAPGAVVELGDLVLQPPSTLLGELVDENGKPIADYAVELHGGNDDRFRARPERPTSVLPIDHYVARQRSRSDALGRFQFTGLAKGHYVLRAQRLDSHEVVEVPILVMTAGDTVGARVPLFRGLTLGGQVVTSDGGALPKCYVSIDPEDGQGTSGDVEVAADGTFAVRGLAPGPYRLSLYPYASDLDKAIGRSFAPGVLEHVLAGSLAVPCQLRAQRLLQGTVLDSAQSPAVGRFVLAMAGDSEVDRTSTDHAGRFSILEIGRAHV